MILSANSRKFITDTIASLEQYCNEQFPSMTTAWKAESLGGVGGKPVQVRLSGKDIYTLFSLTGIIIYNAIVLIDRIGIEINDNGLEPAQAVVHAAQQRLRPILLTTAATIGGLLPLCSNSN